MAREGVQIYDMNKPDAPYIDEAALNVTTNGDTIPCGDKRTLRADIKATFVSDYSAIQIYLQHYSDMLGDWCDVHEIASGGASTPFVGEYTVGASKNWSVAVDIAPYEKVRLVITSTGGIAAETISVWHALVLD